MANEQVTEVSKEQTQSTGAASPATVDPAVVSVEAASPSATASDSLAPATAGETTSTTPEVKLHTEVPTLLEEATKVEPKPAETKVETKPEEKVETKPETKPEEKPKDLLSETIVYTDFEVPEGLELKGERLQQYKDTLAKYHLPQEGGQELLNLHAEVIKQYEANTMASWQNSFLEMRKSWQAEVMADEQLGGSGHHTSMQAIARMRDKFVPEKDRASFDEFLRITGAGDHPAFLKLLHNAARLFDEPAPPKVVGTPVPQKKNGTGAKILYDHPSSQHPR
jgi:hypothetical protein